jgi:DNA (cytosine-5)-methyltransferase 1
MPIPVVDLFAGPGGLGEGFSAFRREGKRVFKIMVSIEKDAYAHRTLELRAFYRQFPDSQAPEEYYDYLAGLLPREVLFARFPEQAERAGHEAWHATLGDEALSPTVVDDRIRAAVGAKRNWVLIGGPPCQAYSLAGRSRRKNDPTFATDEKHFLYEQYLRIIAVHQPPVFVMENVKGLLSAKVQEEGIFDRILTDLQNPLDAVVGPAQGQEPLRYRLFSLVTGKRGRAGKVQPEDFIVRAEDYGIPQARHRLILLGLLADSRAVPDVLQKQAWVPIEDVISNLPRLRSGLSKEQDSGEAWRDALRTVTHASWLHGPKVGEELRREILSVLWKVDSELGRGGEYHPQSRRSLKRHRRWFIDRRLGAVCNHSTRSHIRADLHRYLFVAAFGRVHGRSPLLGDFPAELLPLHENVAEALRETKFNDRFRVQLAGRPSTTVTSHISKDGHYFIHYDPSQCRSLTVREAARLQTFPDNYFFEGPRTEQYHQVGNAVPPLLARKIARIVANVFR